MSAQSRVQFASESLSNKSKMPSQRTHWWSQERRQMRFHVTIAFLILYINMQMIKLISIVRSKVSLKKLINIRGSCIHEMKNNIHMK